MDFHGYSMNNLITLLKLLKKNNIKLKNNNTNEYYY